MAPAMKNAGIRHSKTCSCAYHFARPRLARMASKKRSFSTGRNQNAVNTASMMASLARSLTTASRRRCRDVATSATPRHAKAPCPSCALFQCLRGAREEPRDARREQRVDHDASLAPVAHDAVGTQHGQVFRDGGAVRADQVREFPHRAGPARQAVHDLQAGLVGERLQDLGLAPEEVVAIAVLADTVVKNTDWVPTVLVPTVPANTVVATRHGSSITLGTIARSHRHAS